MRGYFGAPAEGAEIQSRWDGRLSARISRLLKKSQENRNQEGRLESKEYFERESKYLGLGDDGVARLEEYLETKYDAAVTKDRILSDEYFELRGGTGAKHELGDWPRIRTEHGKRRNVKTGEMEDFYSVEFTVKGKPIKDKNYETRVERGNTKFVVVGSTVVWTEKLEDNTSVEKRFECTTPEEAQAKARVLAEEALRAFLKNKLKVDDARLMQWSNPTKRRRTQEIYFTDSDGEVRKLTVRYDYEHPKTRHIIFPERKVASNDLRKRLVRVYELNGVEVPQKLLTEGKVIFEEGETLTIPLGHIPAYVEVEVKYPVIHDTDSEEVKAKKRAETEKLKIVQEKVEADIQKNVFDVINAEREESGGEKIERVFGDLGVVYDRYDVPNFDVRSGPEESKETAQ